MKTGIIARGLTKGGVARFIRNILHQFNTMAGSDPESPEFVVFTDSDEFSHGFNNISVIHVPRPSAADRINKLLWDYAMILPRIMSEKPDVLIFPKNIIPFTSSMLRCRMINIIHDLGYFESNINPYPFWDTVYMKSLMSLSCSIASRTIAVSHSTKNDLIDRFRLNPGSIDVCHEGVEKKFRPVDDQAEVRKTLDRYGISRPFVLYCGSLSPRKNVLGTLKAFDLIKKRIPHNIYLAVNYSLRADDTVRFMEHNLGDRAKIIGFTGDEDLVRLYSAADLFMYPSLYEGFGLPILEAQACGCPVITSNVTSCPEVAGKGAHIVDPFSITDMSRGMEKVLKDSEYKKTLIEEGRKNTGRFSWKKTARNILETCNKSFKQK